VVGALPAARYRYRQVPWGVFNTGDTFKFKAGGMKTLKMLLVSAGGIATLSLFQSILYEQRLP
jgi:hypothetical protein